MSSGKVYLPQSVLEAAKVRIAWLFDEFDQVIVNYSGGKDSATLLHLTLEVAEEKGKLPVPLLFIDQEAEWKTVIEHIREVMSDPRVEPAWLQVPFKVFNATSTIDPWLECWEPGKENLWMRPKEPDSIHENVYGTDRFAELFDRYVAVTYEGKTVAQLAGVRCSESPARMKGLTSYATYKWITWGSKSGKKGPGHFTFYPLFDWSDSDVWKAIHEHGWPYCKIYDAMYQQGVPFRKMRVSNLHHETAVETLFYLQEIEKDTWERLSLRLSGVNTAKHLRTDFLTPTELPPMFADWREYRDYLLEKLIDDPEHRKVFASRFASADARYVDEVQGALCKMQIASILTNDYHGTKEKSFVASHGKFSKNAGRHGGLKIGISADA